MSVVVVGLSHHTSSTQLRERLHFQADALPKALRQLSQSMDGAATTILTTCNRVEVYMHHAAPPEAICTSIRHFLCEWHQIDPLELENALYEYADREAVTHLFRVASGLDSLVVGEGQVLGQVHDAYDAAVAAETTDKVMNALFQRAFSTAKEIRTASKINEGKVSIGSVAVDLAVSIFMDLKDKTVMVIGSGKMGELALKSLLSRGVGSVLLVNRSVEKARELARQFSGEALALADLHEHLHRADILISSTAATEYVLNVPDFQQALKRRGNEPMFLIDIAVPRDINPAVNDLDNVYLYGMDNLKQVADENLEARREEVARCMVMVEKSVDRFLAWHRGLLAEPMLVSIAEELNAIRERELEKTIAALSDLNPKQKEEIEYLTRRIVNAILQRPMSGLKREVAHHDPHTVLHLVRRLFGLKEIS